ncbi:MAG: glycosyltransferase family 2 protein, partial [Gluconobacter albidus]
YYMIKVFFQYNRSEMEMNLDHNLATYTKEPIGCTVNNGIFPDPKYKFSLVACARWEDEYICEWINYHRSIGIDHIYLYSNDDSPERIFSLILPYISGDNPFVTFRHYPIIGQQYQMYFHFLRNFSTETEWLMFLDIDEFLCLKGHNSLPFFMKTILHNIDGIHFNWCCYGNNRHKKRPSGSVLLNYTRRENGVTPYTKVLIRSKSIPYHEIYKKSSSPIMHEYNSLDKNLNMVNVLGEDTSNYYENFPDDAWSILNSENRRQKFLSIAYIAHFTIKSEDDFDRRVQRGTQGDYNSEKIWGTYSLEQRENYLAMTNSTYDDYLHNYWKSIINRSWEYSIFPYCRWDIISKHKSATQISTVHPGSVDEDAQRVLSGNLCGKSQNHTALENNPWWQVDLGAVYKVHEMRLFNRLDGVVERVANFILDASINGNTWFVVMRKNDNVNYGGADGSPYIWVDIDGIEARFLRLTIPHDNTYLHFDQIQFFGNEI